MLLTIHVFLSLAYCATTTNQCPGIFNLRRRSRNKMAVSFGFLLGNFNLSRNPFRRDSIAADPMLQLGYRVGLNSARGSVPLHDDLEIIVPEEDEVGENAVRAVQRPAFRHLFIERGVRANPLDQFGFRVGEEGINGTRPDDHDLQVVVRDEHSPRVVQRTAFTSMFDRGLRVNPLLQFGLDSQEEGSQHYPRNANFDDDLQVVDTDEEEDSQPRLMERRTAFRRLHHRKFLGCTSRAQRARGN